MARFGDLTAKQAEALGRVIASRIELRIELDDLRRYPDSPPTKGTLRAIDHAVDRIAALEAALRSGE